MNTAELGDYDPQKHKEGYVSHFKLVAKQSADLDEQIGVLHQALSGKATSEAEYQFLTYARRYIRVPVPNLCQKVYKSTSSWPMPEGI